jgi:hypothetical protein
MVRLPLLTAIAAFAALPAAAQYIDQGYRDAHAIFGNVGSDIEFAIANMEKLIPALQGRWIPVDLLVGGGPSPDANSPLNDYEQYCGRTGFDLTATSRFSFQMLQNDLANPESPTVTYRFDYSGFNAFIRSRDTGELFTRLGLEDEELPVSPLVATLSQAIVLLYHPNRDSLVLVNISGRTEYYGRCP